MIAAQARTDAAHASAVAPPPLLEVRQMIKDFPGTRALDHVDLTVRAGEIHALLGENGAGKSTIIKCICGAQPATAGEVLIDGEPVSITSPQEAQAAGIAVVHQHTNLIPELSVEENLCLGEPLPRIGGVLIDWPEVRRRARAVLSPVDLDISPAQLCADLRPDQLAMVAIARAVARKARLIILDEPTAALLPREVETLFAQMRVLASRGVAFLYVSHRLTEVFDIADRVTVLRDGRNAGTFDKDKMDRKSVVSAIVGAETALRERHITPVADGPALLSVKGLHAARVNGVSFDLRPGEVLGVAGLPGSGAEEVLNLLFGRTRLEGGEISMDGAPLKLRNPADAIRAGFALVPQDRLAEAVLHGYSVRENITLPSLAQFLRERVLRLVHGGREKTAARDVIARMNVRTPGTETLIDALSGGNQQKAVLGRWLTTGARVFLLNSPTAAVDVGAKAEIYELIAELAAAGASVLFTSTEVEEFPVICGRVLVFSEGRIAGELHDEQVTEANIMTIAAGESLEQD
ncbi:MAG: sugar ABC transporter ATP-binding protein [Pararhodobacter sp.]|nr:sugar ABC transporter ATP-binding protein [Pararhodobacter sp.]